MKNITIDGVEYTFEFSIEASLYSEATRSIMDGLISANVAQSKAEDNDIEGAIRSTIEEMTDIPQKALTLFYAGLLEHHGVDGDGTIKTKKDAKVLLVAYIKESEKTFYDIMSDMMEIIIEDHFLETIGLDKMFSNALQTEKKPRRKRTTKVGETS